MDKTEGVIFKERDEMKVAVFMILLREVEERLEVLLQERQNTGYKDGLFDFSASGHLKIGESYKQCAVREAAEELGVTIKEEDADFAFLGQGVEEGYVRIFFITTVWEGEPRIMEPEKCAKLEWFSVDELPEDMIENYRKVLEEILRGENFGPF